MSTGQKKPIVAEANKIGYIGCTSYVLSNVIGAGIFISPSSVTQNVGSVGLSLLVWLTCGLLTLLGSIVYIELGTGIPQPGCDFAYTCHVGWHPAAFAFMWVGVLLTYPASVAVQIVIFGHYIMDSLSAVFTIAEPYNSIIEWLLGISLMIAITWINFHSLGKFVSIFQTVATVAKLGAMIIIIMAGLYCFFFKDMKQNYESPMSGSNLKLSNVVLGLYAGLYAYGGWDILNYSVNEIRNPRKNMPLSLLTALPMIALLYTMQIFSYFVVLSPEEVKNTHAIAASFSQEVFGQFSYFVPFMIALSICSSMNSNVFCASRYMYAAAREGHLPPYLSCINEETGSPRAALLTQVVLTIIMTFVSVERLIEYVAFIILLQKMVALMALFWIRYKKIPVDENVVRIPIIFTIVFFAVSVLLVVVPIIFNFMTTIVGIVITSSGLVLYFIFVRPETIPGPFQKANDWLTNGSMKLLNCKTDRNLHYTDVEPTARMSIQNDLANHEEVVISKNTE